MKRPIVKTRKEFIMRDKLSIITDEFSQDLSEIIAFAKKYDLHAIELRTIDNLPLEKLSEERLHEIKACLDENQLIVCDLSTSFYKCRYADREGEIDKLKKLIRAAQILQVKTLRVFAFLADGAPDVETIAKAFEEPLRMMEEAGLSCYIECDPSVSTSNHQRLMKVIDAIHSPIVGAIYDPGNCMFDPLMEVPYPDGYRYIRPLVLEGKVHVHVKDGVRGPEGTPCMAVGTGEVDYRGLLKALKKDGYQGYLSIETHYRKARKIGVEGVQKPGGSSFSEGGYEASCETMEALIKLLEEIEA